MSWCLARETGAPHKALERQAKRWRMRGWLTLWGLILALAGAVAHAQTPPVILISIDGFRPDYLTRGVSPTLAALADTGVRAERMIPSYPSVTFPNHTALVTGLYPDHNGIVGNTFVDPASGARFTMASKEPQWWDQSTPIWVSAERAGIHTGVEFWPGAGVPHQGTLPGLWNDFNHAVSPDARVDAVLGWFDRPAAERPGLSLLYFDAVDGAGHSFGPDSPQVNQAVATIDAAIARLIAGLNARGIAANLIVVSDHGMAPVASDHLLFLDDLIDLAAVRVAFDGTYIGLAPAPTPAGAAARAKLLAGHPHLTCQDKADMPARLHYGTNARIPAMVCMVETGWLAMTRENFHQGQAAHPGIVKGTHGYDNADPLMGALFIANGPAFRQHLVVPPFANVDIYPLMARLIGVVPLPGDGTLADLAGALR